MKNLVIFLTFIAFIFIANSCLDADVDSESNSSNGLADGISIPSDFSYNTTRNVSITITAPENLKNAVFSLETYAAGTDSTCFATGTFNNDLEYNAVFSIPTYIDTIKLVSKYTGLISGLKLPVVNNNVSLDLTQYYDGTYSEDVAKTTSTKTKIGGGPGGGNSTTGFTYIRDYNYNGVPTHSNAKDGWDEISSGLLDDINATLTEGSEIPDTHPEYLTGAEKHINLIEAADVWITFVTEDAGNKNALGYYSFPTDNPPSSINDIDNLNIIFPNASFNGSGGGMVSGDKIYLGQFEENTSIGWFIVSNGWNSYNRKVSYNTNSMYFSTSDLNPESNESNRDHILSLYDENRELLLLAIEDMNRDGSSDNDFNDVVFYATANPIDAIDFEDVEKIDNSDDSDGDGVNDSNDNYPDDPEKAFDNYYPSEDEYGTLAFEDLWPSEGDYDINDLVIDYNFNLITNADNNVKEIETIFKVKNIGGGRENGFGFSLTTNPQDISDIEGQLLNSGSTNIGSNGTEINQDEAVIIVAENVYSLTGTEINLNINFSGSVSLTDLGAAPFNPFIIIDQDREKEVHMPDMEPTNLVGESYFGQYDDDSDPENGRYYKTEDNLPWGINVYKGFVVPEEKVSIDQQYKYFLEWANSGGTEHEDWYLYYSY